MKFCPECERELDTDEPRCPHDGTALVVMPEARSLVGERLAGRFQIVEAIGTGGMGSVYRAIQEPIGREVALKVLRREHVDNPATVKRFFHEAKIVSRLRHANTVTLYDFGQAEDGQLYIAMELMRGVSLDRVRADDALTITDIVQIGVQVCASLSEAHEHGIVHRDLKPSNIYIDWVAGRRVVKVLDFGIAKVTDGGTELTLTGMVVGTPAYMSPEQTVGHDLDARSDLYSLGVVLYELLSGAPPFVGEQAVSIAMAQLTREPTDLRDTSLYPDMPASLGRLVGELLAKDPDARPPSAVAVEARLREVGRELAGGLEASREQGRAASPSHLRPLSPLDLGADSGSSGDALLALRERTGTRDHGGGEAPSYDDAEIPPTLLQPIASKPTWGTGPLDLSVPMQDTGEQPQFTPGSVASIAERGSVGDDAPLVPPTERRGPSLVKMLSMLVLLSTSLGVVWVFALAPPEDGGGDGVLGGTGGAATESAAAGSETASVGPGAQDGDTGEPEGSGAASAGPGESEVAALVAFGESLGRASSALDEALPSARAVAAEPPEAPTVVLRFESTPAGAAVRRDGEDAVLCEPTPCELTLARESVLFDVVVTRRRHRPERISVAAAADATYTVELERLPQADEPRRPEGTRGDRDDDADGNSRPERPPGIDLMRPVTIDTAGGGEAGDDE